jgi:serine protease Do
MKLLSEAHPAGSLRFWPILAVVIAIVIAASGASNAALAETKVVPESRQDLVYSYAPVVKRVAPAVVNIFSRRVVTSRGFSLFDDPFFKRFFGDAFGGLPRERIENSLGSGVIVREDGLVVTNNHVIQGASEITVVLNDRREFPAEIVLTDERTDLAILQLESEGQNLPALEFRDSDEIEVGDLVLAIGNPFGVGQTVTSGIVSATARTQVGISDFSFFIQTDAAINPGNSGGALVTLDGKLLGINTAIYSRSGGSVGIGFAIPANMVKTVVASAESGGKLRRAWSGLLGQTLTQELAAGFDVPSPGGVVVNRIYPGGPADLAGLKVGDVILTVNSRRVEDEQGLRYRVAIQELGSDIDIGLWRAKKRHDVVMRAVTAPEVPPRNDRLLTGKHPLAGVRIANLSPALAEELEQPEEWEGLVILEVIRGSPARRLRFRPGDIIHAVNGRAFESTLALENFLKGPSQQWMIRFEREGRVREVEFSR